MKEVYNDRDQIRVGQAKSLLEAVGIVCFVRNEMSGPLIGASLAGVLRQFDPELCVTFDEDYPQAREIIKQWLDEQTAHATGENGAPDWSAPAAVNRSRAPSPIAGPAKGNNLMWIDPK